MDVYSSWKINVSTNHWSVCLYVRLVILSVRKVHRFCLWTSVYLDWCTAIHSSQIVHSHVVWHFTVCHKHIPAAYLHIHIYWYKCHVYTKMRQYPFILDDPKHSTKQADGPRIRCSSKLCQASLPYYQIIYMPSLIPILLLAQCEASFYMFIVVGPHKLTCILLICSLSMTTETQCHWNPCA